MSLTFDLVSNIHFNWICTQEPFVRNSGINIRRIRDEDKVLGYIIVIDHNPMYNLLSFKILKTTIKFYVQECKHFGISLKIRIPIDEYFDAVDKILMESDANFAHEDFPSGNDGKKINIREYYRHF